MKAAAYWLGMAVMCAVLAFGLDMRGVPSLWAAVLAGFCGGACAVLVYYNASAGLVTAATAPIRLLQMIAVIPVFIGARATIGLIILTGVIVWTIN